LKLRKCLASVVVPAVLILLVAAVACEPAGQQPLDEERIMQAVEDEVRFQIDAAKVEMSQDFGPGQGDFQSENMQPLDDLRFELDNLRNQVEGTDPVSRFDLESLSLDIQQVGSKFDSLEFEYARLERLNDLQFQVDDINNNLALKDLDSDQGSDLNQLRFEIDETRGMIEDAQSEAHLELEQLRFQVEDLERALSDFQGDFGLELERFNSRIDAVQ
jgi:hypothetical protein